MKKYDYFIVGSGLFGSTFAHLSNQQGKTSFVIDKRSHLGGNLYCEYTEGINVHKYGAHIFHTNSKRVWDFVNSIVEFNRYTNSPIANYQGKLFNLPFNMNTFYQMWGVTTPKEAQEKIEEQKAEALAKIKVDDVAEPRNLEEQALMLVGRDIYEKLIKGYTEKQWGRKCTDLPAFIIKRLPVRLVFDNNYFNDKYQGIPIGGYNKLFDGLLKGIDTMTNVDFFDCERTYDNTIGYHTIKHPMFEIQCKQIVYCGPIDQFFDYKFGYLQYRSVRFENEILDQINYQGNAVINYTDAEVPYTRIIEHKHFEMFGKDVNCCPKTVISREYSAEWTLGMEPYYPVNDEVNSKLYIKYKHLADEYNASLTSSEVCSVDDGHSSKILYNHLPIIFGGRLAEYHYYDMAPVVDKVLGIFK